MRWADLFVKTASDNASAVIELNATKSGLSSVNLKQLEYYMIQYNTGTDYLINFLHDYSSCFPDVDHELQGRVFQQTVILGRDQILKDWTKCGPTSKTVKIV